MLIVNGYFRELVSLEAKNRSSSVSLVAYVASKLPNRWQFVTDKHYAMCILVW